VLTYKKFIVLNVCYEILSHIINRKMDGKKKNTRKCKEWMWNVVVNFVQYIMNIWIIVYECHRVSFGKFINMNNLRILSSGCIFCREILKCDSLKVEVWEICIQKIVGFYHRMLWVKQRGRPPIFVRIKHHTPAPTLPYHRTWFFRPYPYLTWGFWGFTQGVYTRNIY